ncbi:MAG: DUF1566 domain-containing protein [Campylobacterota bacterium]|nr:DUF1566 domain-containing protein [Campylobacterota bacterium]
MLKKLLLFTLLLTFTLNATAPTQANVTRLYVAIFERAPDNGGLNYWVEESGLDLEGIAMSFFAQEETRLKYPAGTDVAEFVIAVYENLFNRPPDPLGISYWILELESGNIPRSLFVLAVINGAQGDDAVILRNKTMIGVAFADAGFDDASDAECVLIGITADLSSVTLSIERIKQLEAGEPCVVERRLEDYEDAGITGVTEENLDEVNEKTSSLALDDAEDLKEIQKIVDEINDPTGDDNLPVADAGPDQSDIAVNSRVYLDGSASSDPDGSTLTYLWSIIQRPDGSQATLSNTGSVKPTLIVDKAGLYRVKLTVNNEHNNSSDEMNIAVLSVKKTGQTKSYNSSDIEVIDGSVEDDGFYQTGIRSNYTRDAGQNTVTDHITRLIWQDNSDVKTVTKQWNTTDNYNAGNYDNTSGDTAATYCSGLTLGGYSWRLPTISELKDIADTSRSGITIDSTFINTEANFYWSSTSFGTAAWVVNFSNGSSGTFPEKNRSLYVRCVSDGV